MTTVNVTQLVGDDELELVVTLDGDGGIARADLARVVLPVPLKSQLAFAL